MRALPVEQALQVRPPAAACLGGLPGEASVQRVPQSAMMNRASLLPALGGCCEEEIKYSDKILM